MRTLQVQLPPITGSDVLDWQIFLNGRGAGIDASGTYDAASRKATRDYQESVGLDADGAMGPQTFSRAVRADGFTSNSRPYVAGMDANVDCSRFIAAIKTDGLSFVGRYYTSADSSPGNSKLLTRKEAKALSAAGFKLVAVHQDFNNRIDRFSAEIGTRQATKALERANAVGQPAGSAIYFAVDFDPTTAEVRGTLSEYFQAIGQKMAGSAFSVGVYGSGLTCGIIRDAGLAQFAWLCGSTGFTESRKFRPRAHILQVIFGNHGRGVAPGLQIDDNVAQAENFGAFQVS